MTAGLTVAKDKPFEWPVAFGILMIVVSAVFWWIAFSRWGKPQGVNTNEYQQLVVRLDQLQAITDLSPEPGLGGAAVTLVGQARAALMGQDRPLATDLEAAIALQSASIPTAT